ncbi:AAA family ATPase [Catenibacterium sp.]|uniref:AAA family ATPase n=1 Tax=Catenibacterium sp. TaxID=2049022 RepID=UPI002E78226E|nr:AAA family ATPase [Catenibacterium sp.]MEE0041689.1 AAA family ATPase [Catenibacterium sp.]
MKQYNLLELLDYINPSELSYQEWTNVGMALKHEGYEASDWDSWSAQDSERYKRGECFTKWNSFNETAGDIVTGGTIFDYAKRGGFVPPKKIDPNEGVLDWEDEIGNIIDKDSIDSIELHEPSDSSWNPANELIRYLTTLFDTDEYVGFVVSSIENEKGKFIPGNRGNFRMTAGQIVEGLHSCNGDIGAVIGDYNQAAGAWIRFNPLNGEGVRNTDIASFKYALVESDSLDIGKQLSIIHQLELPVAAVVYSGAKSIHAIVKVDASDNKEYRERVSYLYKICDKNGLEVDSQNKNPSRLSRMPGCIRGDHKQFIIETNTGKETWSDWVEWVESMNDDLPDEENLADVLFNLPDYAEELIEGILRQGHKMLLVGPSKSGKSFSLIELCIAIAEGTKWMGRQCKQGDVLYVNFELDRASCLHRFKDVYQTLGLTPNNANRIFVWNLRGKTPALDQLVPKLIRRAEKKKYIAVVVDPIYKVITGDENSASEMAKFCNQFDKIADALGASVIYAHHHSKGAQGGKKSMDRASGSGVFARDPDALLDMIELDMNKEVKEHFINEARVEAMHAVLDKYVPKWKTYIYQTKKTDDHDFEAMNDYCAEILGFEQMNELQYLTELKVDEAKHITALQISGTLREFATFDPINCFFKYPVHFLDNGNLLKGCRPEGSKKKSKFEKMNETNKKKQDENIELFLNAFEQLNHDGQVTVKELAESGLMLGKTYSAITVAVPRWIKKGSLEGFEYTKGVIKKNSHM